MAVTNQEIFDKIKEELIDSLAVDDEDVTPDATMVGDLGAESIDFLDIIHRLEKSFDIEIDRSELFPEEILSSEEYVKEGKLTETGLAELKSRMPFVDLSKFEENPQVQEFANLLTVNDLCNYVSSKLG